MPLGNDIPETFDCEGKCVQSLNSILRAAISMDIKAVLKRADADSVRTTIQILELDSCLII